METSPMDLVFELSYSPSIAQTDTTVGISSKNYVSLRMRVQHYPLPRSEAICPARRPTAAWLGGQSSRLGNSARAPGRAPNRRRRPDIVKHHETSRTSSRTWLAGRASSCPPVGRCPAWYKHKTNWFRPAPSRRCAVIAVTVPPMSCVVRRLGFGRCRAAERVDRPL